MIVVTGGAGFIGSAFIWHLNKMGHDEIVVVDSLKKSTKWKNLRNLKFKDYLEKEDFLKLIENEKISPKTIFHFGACSNTTEEDNSYLIKNNFEYSKILAKFTMKKNIKLIYASSAATYGKGKKGFDDDINKLDSLKPLNMYGFSKHIFDLWIFRNFTKWPENILGLKFFNVFGPNEYHKGEMRSMVIKSFENILKTGKVRLFKSHNPEFKDGEQKRDFIYIKDVVKMVYFLFEKNAKGDIYNIGSGKATTWINLITPIFKALKKDIRIEFIPMPEQLRKQYQYYTCANMEKLEKLKYSESIYPIEKAVKEYVLDFLLKNKYIQDEKN